MKYKIVLVEDEINLNNLIKAYLEKAGYEVTTFTNGNDAIKNIDIPANLWILDIMLGDDVNGYDVIKAIREQDDNVPVIFTSARDQELDKIFDEGGYNKFYSLVTYFKLEDYLNIKLKKIANVYDRYGVWAQIESDLPFTRVEKDKINKIKTILSKYYIDFSDLKEYDSDIIMNAARILNMDKEVEAMKGLEDLHSIIDIDISINTMLNYVSVNNIRKIYKIIERNIIEGKLDNNSYSIEEFLRKRNYE